MTIDGTNSRADRGQPDPNWPWRLNHDDQAACDRVIGREPGQTSPRDARVAQLSALLSRGLSLDSSPSLLDSTLALLAAADLRDSKRAAEPTPELVPDDEEAVDAWVLSEYRAKGVPASLRARAERVEALGRLIDSPSASAGTDRAALLGSVMARLDRADASIPIASRRAPVEAPVGVARSFRIRDLVSAAAVIAIGSAVVWPVFSAARSTGVQGGCNANLASIASSLAAYATDFRDRLPVATAGLGGTWSRVGTTPEQSNSANLYTLTRTGYATLATLACSGNPAAPREARPTPETDWRTINEVSYSYRIMFGTTQVRWRDPSRSVVLADRSPVMLRASRQELIYPLENSPNHEGQGQRQLFADGSSRWLCSPIIQKPSGRLDNIWLPLAQEQEIAKAQAELRRVGAERGILQMDPLTGSELPASPDDDFVGP